MNGCTFTQSELEAIEAEDVDNQRRARQYAAAARRNITPALARDRARKLTMHALRERGEMRAMVRDLQHAIRLMIEAPDKAEARTLGIVTTADINHRLWQLRQVRRAAFGRA